MKQIEIHSLRESTKPDKKLMAQFTYILNGKTRKKTVHFGASKYEDYTIHKDKERRERYRQRHEKDLKSENVISPGYLSYYVLWGESPDISQAFHDYIKKFDISIAPMDKNNDTYKKAVELADNKYNGRKSAYRSMEITKQYYNQLFPVVDVRIGDRSKGLTRWINEKWIEVFPYLGEGLIIPCGSNEDTSICRPMKGKYRISKYDKKKILADKERILEQKKNGESIDWQRYRV